MKKTLTLLLCLALVLSSLCIFPVSAAITAWDGETVSLALEGSGTEDDPYLIRNGADLQFMREQINSGADVYASAYYLQTANIDLGGATVDPIGPTKTTTKFLSGSYDGGKFTISNFTINSADTYVGLFGYLTGTVKNVNVVNAQVTATKDGTQGAGAGIVVGYSKAGTVENCTTDATSSVETGSDYIGRLGGIVGYAYPAVIKNCINAASVTFDGSKNAAYVGGISSTIGNATATTPGVVENCINLGPITISENGPTSKKISIGGIIGMCGGGSGDVEIKNCYNAGTVSSKVTTSTNFGVGGIGGENAKGYCTFTDCYNIGVVSTPNGTAGASIVGGIAGSAADESAYNYGLKLTDAQDEKGYVYNTNTGGALADNAYNLVATQNAEITLSNGQKSTIAKAIAAIKATVDAAIASNTPETEITGRHLSVSSDLAITYYATVDAERFDGDAYTVAMVFSMKKTDGEQASVTVEGELDPEEGKYSFRFAHVAPQVMAETITASLVSLDGEGEIAYTLDTYNDSVKKYLVQTAEQYSDSEALVTLVSDLLVYGQAAQDYLGATNIAKVLDGTEEWLTPSDADAAESLPTKTESTGVSKFTGAGVRVGNVNKLYFTFTADAEKTVTVNIDGKAVEAIDLGNGAWAVYSEGVSAKHYATDVTAELLEDGEVVQTITYSINDYAYAMKDHETAGDVATALYRFGASAAAYAGSAN